MVRSQEPVSDEELEALRNEMNEQRHALREALAEDLGGAPVDYGAATYLRERTGEPVADGGDD